MSERSKWIALAGALVVLSIFRIGIAVVVGTPEHYVAGGVTAITLWIFAGMCIWLVRHDDRAAQQARVRSAASRAR